MISKISKNDLMVRWQTFGAHKNSKIQLGDKISRLLKISHKKTGTTVFGNLPEGIYSPKELREKTILLELQLTHSLLQKLTK